MKRGSIEAMVYRVLFFLGLVVFAVNGLPATRKEARLEKEVDWEQDLIELKDVYCERDRRFNPFYEKRYGQGVVWQIPANPKAVLHIAHGSGSDILSYFDNSTNCPLCYGLPEDRLIVLEALARGYAVILVKSLGVYWQTWPPNSNQDLVIVSSIIHEWRREHSLESLPLALLGNSNGGNFSSVLTLVDCFKVSSLVLTNSPGETMVMEHANAQFFPPTFFADMPKDVNVFYFPILNSLSILKSRGVKVGEFKCWQVPLSPDFFSERIRCPFSQNSEKIFEAFLREGWFDERNYLKYNPRIADWKSVLRKYDLLPLGPDGQLFAKYVEAELKMAFAEHAVSSKAIPAIFAWLDSTVFSETDKETAFHAPVELWSMG